MKPSGAGVSNEKVAAVLNYLRQAFAPDEVAHLPKPDEIGDLFRGIRKAEVLHQLMIRRPFYDRHDDLALMLKQMDVDALVRKSGTQIVYLQ